MRIFVVLTIILIWVFSLVNESGLGMKLHTGEKMNWLIFIWAVYLFFIRGRRFIPKMSKASFMGFFLFFILIAYVVSGRWDGATYLISFLTVFCFSNIDLSAKELSVSAFAIGLLGLGLITIYTRTQILSGWNDNSIAMLTLFSFIYFSIFFNSSQQRWIRSACWIMAFAYISQIAGTDSRGSLLFMLLSIVMMFARETTYRFISSSTIRALIVYFPIIIAIVVVWITSQDWFVELDNWSRLNFGKPIFNGRDELWADGFKDIINYPFGRGKFVINYHNSAVGCIGVFGIVGYVLWCNFFKRQLSALTEYLEDYTVYACMCAFILIYLQQSVELGFINRMPNMIPYMILGLGLGKVRMYESSL
jgi:hypothetical protein